MASTVSDREMRGSDFAVFKSQQTAKGAINVSPVFTKMRRTEGKTSKVLGYTEDPTVNNEMQGLEQIQETKDLTAEIQATNSKQTVGLIIEALHGVEVAITVTDTDIASTATGFTSVGAAFGSFLAGDVFWVSGFADADIDGAYIVSTGAAGEIVTTIAPPSTEVAGASVTVETNRTWNADLPTYDTLQTQATDMSKGGDNINYHTLYDAILNSLSIEIGETGITTNTASFVAEKELEGSDIISGQTVAPLNTDKSVTSIKGGDASIQGFYLNGLSATCIIKSLSLEINSNYEKDDSAACDSLYVRGQPSFSGSSTVRSKISSPFDWRDYSWNGTRVEIAVRMSHGNGQETAIVLRQCVITEASQPDGRGAIANTEASFVCEKDTDAAVTVALYRNW